MNRQTLLVIVLSVLCYRTAPALEVNLLSVITDSPRDFKVRKDGRNGGYIFGWDVKSIKAEEKLLQEVIVNIESNKEFVIYTSIKTLSSRPGALFSISHSQRKLLLLDLFTKGIGNKTKLILRYRSTEDKAEDVVFKGVGVLSDRRFHTIVLRISDVMTDNGKKISSVTLYVDCKPFGKVETVSPISSIFSYKGTLLSRLEFRLAQRGFGGKTHTQWRGVMESMLLIFKRPIREILDELDCAPKPGGLSGVKAPQQPLIANEPRAITHEVIRDLIGVIKDLRYDLSMQVAEIKYLRGLVENCQMCRVQDFCRFKPCFPGVPCFNEPASEHGFECGECPLGMLGDGINCTDIDECKLADPCAKNTLCHNRSPGYWCPPCPPGYSGKEIHGIGLYYARNNKQECSDIDECAENPPKCAKESTCINTQGGYTCGDCAPGYTGDPYRSCYYLSYCDPSDPRSNPCHQYAKCIRLDSGRSFKCECRSGYAGNGLLCAEDFDIDGFADVELNCSENECRKDNCPQIKNPDQADLDEDGIGDVCDDDWDGDGIKNSLDNCPRHSNSNQRNSDGDLLGNECDNCPFVSNSYQGDIDKDGQGDACDKDVDDDGQLNSIDNCPTIYNPGQEDQDGDTVGDVCDNCPSVRNSRQFDRDDDGIGDNCDTDRDDDNDGVDDMFDNCRGMANPDQIDNDKDEQGDACDDDDDDDGVLDSDDNCQLVPNPTQRDLNGNGIGDPCDGDFDGDKVPDAEDACPVNYHCSRTDFTRLLTVNISPAEENSRPAVWVVDATGTKVTETENSDPGIAVGDVHFGGVDFTGTLQVATTHDDDFVGIVFSYQNNRKYYLVSWKQREQVYWEVKPFRASAVAGIQIKLVNSNTGPGDHLRNALWHSGDAKGQTKELWRDVNRRGWEDNAEYDWELIHRPSRGLIRLKVFKAGERMVDTGYLIDKTLNGGRLGLYVFSQSNVVWKNMFYKCNEIIPADVSTN